MRLFSYRKLAAIAATLALMGCANQPPYQPPSSGTPVECTQGDLRECP